MELNQSVLEVTFRELKIKQLADWSPQNEKSESSGTTFLVPPQGHHIEKLQCGPLHPSLSVVDLSPKEELIRFHKEKWIFCRVRLISIWKEWELHFIWEGGSVNTPKKKNNWCSDPPCGAECLYVHKILNQGVEKGFWNISSQNISKEDMEA